MLQLESVTAATSRDSSEDQQEYESPGSKYLEEIYLLGHPPLRRFLDVMQQAALPESLLDSETLVNEWRNAHEHFYELAEQEAGLADTIECRAIDPELDPLVEHVRSTPQFQNSFDSLPTRFALVELEKLVVCQAQITKTFVDRLAASLPAEPTPTEIFNFCLATDRELAPIRVRKVGAYRYAFESDSTDLRCFGTELFRSDQIAEYTKHGPRVHALGVVVGFGSNFLNVLKGDDRCLLHNGHHRACALYQRGVKYAPCIVQTVTRRDEIDIAAKRAVAQDPGYYFKAPRPPLLKDFFNPRLSKVVRFKPLKRTVEIKIEVHTGDSSETYV